MFADKKYRLHVIYYTRKKSKRFVHSVLESEIVSFADSFDFVYTMRIDLQMMFNKQVRLKVFNGSKYFFESITKESIIAEKRLMINVTFLQNYLEQEKVSNSGAFHTEHNPADAFTKITDFTSLYMILSNKCDLRIENSVYFVRVS